MRSLAISGELYRYIPAMAAYEGFRVTEIPVRHRPRTHGRSKFGLERYVRGFLDLLTILFIGRFRHRPMHLFGGLGLLFVLAGLVISAYLTVLKILGEGIGDRPLLLLAVLLVILGVQFIVMGLIAELTVRTYYETQDLRVYRVREVVGRTDEN